MKFLLKISQTQYIIKADMIKLKVITVFGTRPEIIRLSRITKKLDQFCDHIIVHTGQNYDYELNQIFFEDLNLRKPDFFLNAAGKSGVETIGKTIILMERLLQKLNPDAMLVLGDTNSCLAILAAKRRKIPTFHMEAGNRCFDMRVPEEINRHIVDHIADVNLTYSAIAREYLIKEGLSPDLIIKTGSPMLEVLDYYKPKINSSKILSELNLQKNNYFVLSLHREENIDSESNFFSAINIINTIAKNFNLPVIVSVHPRLQKKINSLKCKFHPNVNLLKPLGFFDYIKLQISSRAVLSDSGTITEESSILNFPALNLREVHERPEGMEEGVVMMTGLNIEAIYQGLEILSKQPRDENRLLNQVSDYSALNVSDKIIRIIQSYTSYVNRVVWKKY